MSLFLLAVRSQLGESICMACFLLPVGLICIFGTRDVQNTTPEFLASKAYIASTYYRWQIRLVGWCAVLFVFLALLVGLVNDLRG